MEHKISIPNPCNENWNSMNPTEKGRFCMSCNKTVVDFTKMKNQEIQKYFVENSDEKICGHFKLTQVESDSNSNYSKFRNRFNHIKIKPVKFLALLSLTAVFSLSSCIMGKRAEVDGEPTVNTDSIHENETKNKLQTEKRKKDSLTIEEKSIKVKK
ncbi:MAG TPA: hypothetical protein VK476_04920 [Flavobacterium sp.]|nr:hypothetical protein [Flavobacterium sp.]